METEVLIIAAIVFAIAGGGWLLYRQRQALIAAVGARGWQWLGSKSDAIPDWVAAAALPRLDPGPNFRTSDSTIFTGSAGHLSYCGFTRQTRRKHGSSESAQASFVLLRDARLACYLPYFQLVRSHGLTDAFASLGNRLAKQDGVQPLLRSEVAGYAEWRVHATQAGVDWLQSEVGQRFAALLSGFEYRAQHAFGVCDQVVFVECMSFTAKRLPEVLHELQSFHELLNQSLHAIHEADGTNPGAGS